MPGISKFPQLYMVKFLGLGTHSNGIYPRLTILK